jgi:hypothetical protein
MHFQHANLGLDAPSKLYAANACCDLQRVIQNRCPSNTKIFFSLHHMPVKMDDGVLQFKMHDYLSFNLKWMLVCMLGWRGIFYPNMYMNIQNAYGCSYGWWICLSLR